MKGYIESRKKTPEECKAMREEMLRRQAVARAFGVGCQEAKPKKTHKGIRRRKHV